MNQKEIQIWNDAVAKCYQAALDTVDQIEAEAADGMASVARLVVRAVRQQKMQGDERDRLPPEKEAALAKLFKKPETQQSS